MKQDGGENAEDDSTAVKKGDCEPNPCGPFTSACVDEAGPKTYSCTCSPGYTNTDPRSCSNINECGDSNACSLNLDYPCRDLEPFYTCVGQFLPTPMPDTTLGAAKTAVYSVDGDTVVDTVTMLRWQRVLPSTYPKCAATVTTLGDACTWDEANQYCDELVLGGFTEWRLPSKIELESLLDLTQLGTALAPAMPALPSDLPPIFWSSSPYSLGEDRYWYVHFGEGWSYFGHPEYEPARVRCVR
ncbi:MAG TPA: DUF1566 domain-containing protein [Polyangiales bacterium]|nr:DUF1566 domain-containing protein [Polyangiales bacterium]